MVLLVVFSIGLFVNEGAQAKDELKLPSVLRIWTYGTGSTGYYCSMGMAPSISKLTGMTVRVIPGGTGMGRLSALIRGEGELLLVSSSSYWCASRGYLDYADPKWGPQKLRLVYGGQSFNMGVMVRGDSGIKVMSDLKGKRFPYTPGNPTGNLFQEAYLAFGGLTWKDVKVIKIGSWSDAMRSVVRGECDGTGTTFTTAAARETAAGPHGIYYIPMPHKDKKAWARYQKVMPFSHPHMNTRGPGLSEKNPHEGNSYRQPYAAYADLPDDIAYAFAKAAYEGYDQFKDRHTDLVDFDQKCTIENITDYSLPMHPGAIKFFKEIGKWTDKAQKWQEERLLVEKTIDALWYDAPMEAQKAGIKVGKKGWPEFWRQLSEKKLAGLKLRYAYP